VKFSDTAVQGARIVEINRIIDDRGFCARVWCQDEFAQYGITATRVRANVGRSVRAGTLRGRAHGYQTLADDSEIVYFTSAPYDRDAATSSRYGDPAFGSNGRSPSR